MSARYTNCIFEEEWWLNTVCPNEWEEVVCKNGDDISGRLVYKKIQTSKTTYAIVNPPLTKTVGPWLKINAKKNGRKIEQEKKIINKLIGLLPSVDELQLSLHHSFINWQPFYWNGFYQTCHYTYIINKLDNIDEIWSGFDDRLRNVIRKAETSLIVHKDISIDDIYEVILKSYDKKNMAVPYSKALFERIMLNAETNNALLALGSLDKSGNIYSVSVVIYDDRAAYYLIGATNPEYHHNGAQSLLLWESIKYLIGKTQSFDFEGSMNENIAKYFRGFGGEIYRYSKISKMSKERMLKNNLRAVYSVIKNEPLLSLMSLFSIKK